MLQKIRAGFVNEPIGLPVAGSFRHDSASSHVCHGYCVKRYLELFHKLVAAISFHPGFARTTELSSHLPLK